MRDSLPSIPTGHRPKSTNASGKPPQRATGELPQFPGVVFDGRGAELNDQASENDAAIRASLIYFKHRWPGQAAVIEERMRSA